MAKREGRVDSAGEEPALDAVQALQPEAKATIAGRELVFREYAALEGFQVAYDARDFIRDMYAESKASGIRYATVRRLFGAHMDVVLRIAAQSAGVEVAWLRDLGRTDLDEFLSTWFAVNAGFFVGEVLVEAQEDSARMVLNSTAPSSASAAPGSGISTGSSASPSVN